MDQWTVFENDFLLLLFQTKEGEVVEGGYDESIQKLLVYRMGKIGKLHALKFSTRVRFLSCGL